MSVLVTGASSGLGKYLKEYFHAEAFDRNAPMTMPETPYDAIIHCAFNLSRDIPAEQEAQYMEDTLGLTQRLLALPHQRFVFISTIDVYPPQNKTRNEADEIHSEQIEGRYGQTKFLAELLVNMQGENPLILRPSAMLGPYIRKNSLLKILSGENPTLTLASDSIFNYVLHEDIAKFIDSMLDTSVSGTFNIAASTNVMFGEICDRFQKPAQFGNYRYNCGSIDNRKAASLYDGFNHSSIDNVERFISGIKV